MKNLYIAPILLLTFLVGTCAEDCIVSPLVAQQRVPEQLLPLPTDPPPTDVRVFRRVLPSDVGTAVAWLVQTPDSAAVIVANLAGLTVYRCYEARSGEYTISKRCPQIRVTRSVGVDTVVPLRVDLEPVDQQPSESWIVGRHIELGKQVCSKSGCTQWRASWPAVGEQRGST